MTITTRFDAKHRTAADRVITNVPDGTILTIVRHLDARGYFPGRIMSAAVTPTGFRMRLSTKHTIYADISR